MQPSANTETAIAVHRVPRHAIKGAMRTLAIADLLAHGLAAARVDDARPCVLELMSGAKQLWVACGADGKTPQAVCTTKVTQEPGGKRWVCLAELAGKDVRRWADDLLEAVAAFAAEHNCSRVLFVGRPAWGRLVRSAREVRRDGDLVLFERAAP
jgi:hypothetical protein